MRESKGQIIEEVQRAEAGGTGSSSGTGAPINAGRGYSRFGVEHRKIKIDDKSESFYQIKESALKRP